MVKCITSAESKFFLIVPELLVGHDNPKAVSIEQTWKQSGYTGIHLVRGLSTSNLAKASTDNAHIGHTHNDHISKVDTDQMKKADRKQTEQDKKEKQELASMREAGRCADDWVDRLVEAAEDEQEREWAIEHEHYRPQDPRLGRGEAALCLLLHPPNEGRIVKAQWGTLQLMNIGPPYTTGPMVHVDTYLRLIAGCCPTTKAYQCKHRKKAAWKRPNEHTEQERTLAASCPCNRGIQDSLHFLECSHAQMVRLRQRALLVADGIMEEARMEDDPVWDYDKQHCKRSKRDYSGKMQFIYQTQGHRQELDSWDQRSEYNKLLITLGISGTDITTKVRTSIVNACIPIWAGVEALLEFINDEE